MPPYFIWIESWEAFKMKSTEKLEKLKNAQSFFNDDSPKDLANFLNAHFQILTEQIIDRQLIHLYIEVMDYAQIEVTSFDDELLKIQADKKDYVAKTLLNAINRAYSKMDNLEFLMSELAFDENCQLIDIERLIDAVSIVRRVNFEDVKQETEIKNKVLGKVLELLIEIRDSKPTTNISKLNSISLNTRRGTPKKTAENNARFAYIRSLIDSGMSETKAFKQAADTFHVSVDSLRKPYKSFSAKREKLEEALKLIPSKNK